MNAIIICSRHAREFSRYVKVPYSWSSIQGYNTNIKGLQSFQINFKNNAISHQQQRQIANALLFSFGPLSQTKYTGLTQMMVQIPQQRWMSGFGNFQKKSSSSVKKSSRTREKTDPSERKDDRPEKKDSKEKPEPNSFGDKGSEESSNSSQTNRQQIFEVNLSNYFLPLTLLSLFVTAQFLSMSQSDVKEINFEFFRTQLLAKGYVTKVEVVNRSVARVFVGPEQSGDAAWNTPKYRDLTTNEQPRFYFTIGSIDSFEKKIEDTQKELGFNDQQRIPVVYSSEQSLMMELVRWSPTLVMLGLMLFITQRGAGGAGFMNSNPLGGNRGLMGVTKAQVTVVDKHSKDRIKFKDVAGCDEAKTEIMEFVDFLKNPKKYHRLGARIPRGALLVGPPGTGKTLLAKATAGEADVPFLSISGSDFVEMFVGVGSARVRDLFQQARAQQPSIVFIDEIDAIGRARGRNNMVRVNDERENTLNQLLVELDGFTTTSGVVVLAGTNRADVLDQALLRPGRFDRQIALDAPDIKGREAIFKIHLQKIVLDGDVETYAKRLAALTPGFAGADIANVCNEAALMGARRSADSVSVQDFENAVDRVIGGLEKKNKVISKEERKTVAYHEAGHAVVSWFLQHCEPLLKVSIVPRGTAALGFAQYLPNENLLMTKEQMMDSLCMMLGGRASEDVMLGKISSGAQNDLEKVTRLAYTQVAVLGMNDTVGLVSFPPNQDQFGKAYSEDTAKTIDTEVRALISEAYDRTVKVVSERKELIEALAQALLTKEVLNREQIEGVLGPRPYKSEELQNIDKFLGEFQKDVGGGQEGDKKGDGEGGGNGGSEGEGEGAGEEKEKIVAT